MLRVKDEESVYNDNDIISLTADLTTPVSSTTDWQKIKHWLTCGNITCICIMYIQLTKSV